jgi:ACS family tartrate transporter-like MFS transporter
MIVWGLLASSMMFMKSTTFFYVMRFLLGVAEAGFFPGIILYLTYWFPARKRAHTIAIFATGAIIAGIIGSPVSGALLELDGLAGLKGWQWLFLIEGIPAVLLGFVVFFFLPDKPSSARWLSSQEKDILDKRIKEDELLKGEMTHTKLREALTDSRVWLLCLMYFLLNVGGYGYELWMPTIIRNLSGASYSLTGFINAVPYIVAGVVMLLVSKHSDLTGERRWYVFFGAVVSAVGFAFSAWFKNPFFAIIALTVAFAGLKSTVGPFWAMGTSFLSGSAAAGGIAIINSVGNLGGFTGPVLVGFISGKTGNNVYSLLLLGFALLIMGMLALTVKKRNIQLH